jgi:hypothetical protein
MRIVPHRVMERASFSGHCPVGRHGTSRLSWSSWTSSLTRVLAGSDLADWVFKSFERVRSQAVVRGYLHQTLQSIGVVDLGSDQVSLTSAGDELRTVRTRAFLLDLLQNNVLGVQFLSLAPAPIAEMRRHLIESIGVSWDTDAQVTWRLRWLVAASAVDQDARLWRIASREDA